MAEKQKDRHKQEQGMLNNIGGRGTPSPSPAEPSAAAPSAAVSIGWMGFVGGALWATVLCGVGLIAWLFFTRGG